MQHHFFPLRPQSSTHPIVHRKLFASVVGLPCAVQRRDRTCAKCDGRPYISLALLLPQELNLLRRTPTRDLTRIFAIRAATMATRIQRCWRQYGGNGSVRGGGAGDVANGKYVRHSPSGAQDRPPTNDSEGQTITAPKIDSSCRRYTRLGI